MRKSLNISSCAVLLCSLALMLSAFHCAAAQETDEIKFVFPFKSAWSNRIKDRETTGYRTAIFATPRYDKERVYFASMNGVVYAYFKLSGELSWKFTAPDSIQLDIALGDSILYLTDGSQLYALEAETGSPHWIVPLPSTATAGLIFDSRRLYLGDVGGRVCCLNAADGSQVWEYRPDEAMANDDETVAIRSGIHADGQYVAYGDEQGTVTVLSAENGQRLWNFTTGGAIRSGVGRRDERLYFGSNDNYIYCLDIASGKLHWRQRAAGDVRGEPTFDDEYIYITSRDRLLRIVNRHNGYPARKPTIPLGRNIDVEPTRVGKYLLLASSNIILFFDATGNFRTLGSYYGVGGVISTNIVYDPESRLAFYGSQEGILSAVAPADLDLSSELRVEDSSDIAPAPLNPGDSGANTDLVVTDPVETAIDPIAKAEADQKNAGESSQNTQKKPDVIADKEKSPVDKETSGAEPHQADPDANGAEKERSALEPVDPAPMLARAREAMKKGDFAEAAQVFSDALRLDAASVYTINLGLYCLAESAAALIEQMSGEDIYVFPREFGGKECYFICIGLFPSREEAEAAIESLKLRDRVEAQINALRLDSFVPAN